jgi:hypothetical protein
MIVVFQLTRIRLFIGVSVPDFLQFFLSAHSGKGSRQRYSIFRFPGPASRRYSPRLPAGVENKTQPQLPVADGWEGKLCLGW